MRKILKANHHSTLIIVNKSSASYSKIRAANKNFNCEIDNFQHLPSDLEWININRVKD